MIFSAILRGMAEVLADGGDLSHALRHASRLADDAVGRPVEGTVLSVLRTVADTCPPTGEPGSVTRTVAEHARMALSETTDRLDVLARAGVVDAGAMGLCVVLDALAAVVGKRSAEADDAWGPDVPRRAVTPEMIAAGLERAPCLIRPGKNLASRRYEVMYLLDADDGAVSALRAELDRMGDSVVVAGGEGVWSVHVHADDADPPIKAGIRAGRLHDIRVTSLERRPE